MADGVESNNTPAHLAVVELIKLVISVGFYFWQRDVERPPMYPQLSLEDLEDHSSDGAQELLGPSIDMTPPRPLWGGRSAVFAALIGVLYAIRSYWVRSFRNRAHRLTQA
jgi:hypothetical protein